MTAAFLGHERRHWLRRPFAILATFAGVCVAVAMTHGVTNSVTAEDHTYVERILTESGYRALLERGGSFQSFDDQIKAIAAVQDAVLNAAPVNEGIPLGQGREPKDLFHAGKGLCYDRSRVIEKALSVLGLENRHLAVYARDGGASAFTALLTPGQSSHAVTEVKTARGWMLVDSNVRWLGLTEDGRVISAADIRKAPHLAEARRSRHSSAEPNEIFKRPFTYVLGLYSRHGNFYPPYTPVPDVNLRQLVFNVAD